MNNSTASHHLFLLITLQFIVVAAQNVHADYAELLDDCGNHTDYGLAATEQPAVTDIEYTERKVISDFVLKKRSDNNNASTYPSRYDYGEKIGIPSGDK